MFLPSYFLQNGELRKEYGYSALCSLKSLWYRDRHGRGRWSIDDSLIDSLSAVKQ